MDEGQRRSLSLKKMAGLKPLVDGGRLTAAMASQISDGASAVLLTSQQAVKDHKLTPRARIHHIRTPRRRPIFMLTGPIPATRYALEERAGAVHRRHRHRRDRRGVRARCVGLAQGDQGRPRRRSTPTVARSRWVTRWVPPGPGYFTGNCCKPSWNAQVVATACRRWASARGVEGVAVVERLFHFSAPHVGVSVRRHAAIYVHTAHAQQWNPGYLHERGRRLKVLERRHSRSTRSARRNSAGRRGSRRPGRGQHPASVLPSTIAALSNIGVFAAIKTWDQVSSWPCRIVRPTCIIGPQVVDPELRRVRAAPLEGRAGDRSELMTSALRSTRCGIRRPAWSRPCPPAPTGRYPLSRRRAPSSRR